MSTTLAPTGTVTLCFTDIQGSTALWERLGKPMHAVLDAHNAILRAAAAKHSAYEVKTEGDAFMLAFREASDAVRFALDAQEALDREPWPDAIREHAPDGIRVRMGLHTGEPIARPDPHTGRLDYFGPMVNRAARVASSAHGGQVIVSGTTWDLVREWAAATATSVDLGEHRLKGLERPERLVQVLPQSLALRRFPPPTTLTGFRTNLPHRPTSFVGRERELSAIRAAFAEGTRMVTLTGPGGLGKTRLAQRFGAIELAEYTGGVWFVDATSARDAIGLCTSVSLALGVTLLPKEEPVAQLGFAILARGPLLLILDNLEQCVDAAADCASRWLEVAPELRILATSREVLRIAAEYEHALDALPAPTREHTSLDEVGASEAVQLFVQRARAAKQDFALDASNAADVADLARHLDGLSLAIELAAARVRVMSPREIGTRLAKRFDVLSGGGRDLPPRQRTLRAAIEWSFDLLTPYEQSAFEQCSIFRDGFFMGAAEGVIDLSAFDDAPPVMDVIQSLREKSFLRTRDVLDRTRIGLYESLREFAAMRLDARGADVPRALADRHARYFAKYALSVDEDAPFAVRHPHDRLVCLETENLFAAHDLATAEGDLDLALRSAVALVSALNAQGPYAEIAERMTATHAAAHQPGVDLSEAQERYLWRTCILVGQYYQAHQGQLVQVIAMFEEALALAEHVDSPQRIATILARLGELVGSLGRHDEAERLFAAALERLAESPHPSAESVVHSRLGVWKLHCGKVAEALEHARHAAKLAAEVGDQHGLSWVSLRCIIALQQLNRYEEALATGRQGLVDAELLDDAILRFHFMSQLAEIAGQMGLLTEGREYAERALVLSSSVGSRMLTARAHFYLGRILEAEGDYAAALEQYLQVASMLVGTMDLVNLAIMYLNAAGCLRELRRYSEALAQLDRAIPLLREAGARETLSNASVLRTEVHIGAAKALVGSDSVAELERARTSYVEAAAIVAELGLGPETKAGARLEEVRIALEAAERGGPDAHDAHD